MHRTQQKGTDMSYKKQKLDGYNKKYSIAVLIKTIIIKMMRFMIMAWFIIRFGNIINPVIAVSQRPVILLIAAGRDIFTNPVFKTKGMFFSCAHWMIGSKQQGKDENGDDCFCAHNVDFNNTNFAQCMAVNKVGTA